MRQLSLICATLVATFALSANAATSTTTNESRIGLPSGINVEPTLGLTIFSAVGTNDSKLGNTTGFMGGGLVDIQTPVKMLKAETGLMFVQEGASLPNSQDVTLNYFAIPALAKFSVYDARPMAINLKSGFEPSFLISAKGHATNVSVDVSSQFNTFDIPLVLGAGVAFAVANDMKLTFDINYMRGLLNVAKEDGATLHTQGITLATGMMF